MNRLALAAKTLTTAAIAVQLKGHMEAGARYRAVCKAVHQKQHGQFEQSLSAALQEFFEEQLTKVAAELDKLADREEKFQAYLKKSKATAQTEPRTAAQLVKLVYKPKQWTNKLIDTSAPIIAAYAIKACLAQQKLMGIDVQKIGKAVKVFCPTGPGGGIDPTCSSGGGGDGGVIGSKPVQPRDYAKLRRFVEFTSRDLGVNLSVNGWGGNNAIVSNTGVGITDVERAQVKAALSKSIGAELKNIISDEDANKFMRSYFPGSVGWDALDGLNSQESLAALLLHTWAQTSHDSNPKSIAIQKTIEKKFGLGAYDRGFEGSAYKTPAQLKGETESVLKHVGPVLDAYVDAVYKDTQSRLKDAGITELVLYRGMSERSADYENGGSTTPLIIGDSVVHLQPASSFATSYEVARQFSFETGGDVRTIMAISVPVDKIFATSITGPGCLSEDEVVVLGGKYAARTASWSDNEGGRPTESEFWYEKKATEKKDKPILYPDSNDENADWPKRTDDTLPIEKSKDGEKSASTCGQDADGKFGVGNTCARGDGGSDSTPSPAVMKWAGEKFGNRRASNGKLVSENFAKWFGKSQVVDADGNPQETEPIIAYHGTTHDFNEFTMDKANPENDMGRGHYFTESTGDAQINYAGIGPDLNSRIGREAERIEGDVENILEDYDDAEERIKIMVEEFSISEDVARGVLDVYYNTYDIARGIAEHRLAGDDPHTISAYLKIEKPIVLGDPKWGNGIRRGEEGETVFDIEYDEDDADGRKPDDPDFDPDTSEINGFKGTLVPFLDDVVSYAQDRGVDISEGVEEIKQAASDYNGIAAGELVSRLKSLDNAMDVADENGNTDFMEVVNQALRDAGFDGVIYKDASEHFTNMNIPSGTRHFIVWNSENIKSVDNKGTFDPKNPDITKSTKQSSDCGANAPGGGGFQPGNTCGRSSGGAVADNPKFQAWFKESKVTNADGTPKVVYHGTRADSDFTAFRAPTEREFPTLDQMLGNHFADSDDLAESFTMMSAGAEQGRVIPVYLSIQNPRIAPQRMLDNGTLEHDAWAINRDIVDTVFSQNEKLFVSWITRARGVTESQGQEIFQRLTRGESIGRDEYNGVVGHDLESKHRVSGESPVGSYLSNYDSSLQHLNFAEKTAVIDSYKYEMRKQGYDGIQYTNTAPMEVFGVGEDQRTCWIAFEPTQIKSVTGNSGKFDPKNPDITKSTKATTASDWLLGEVDDAPTFLNDLFAGSSFGKLNIGIATEIPRWMQIATREFLYESFSQDYWKKVSETTYRDIELALERGLERGQSIRAMSKNIAKGLVSDGEDSDYAKVRARRIAITEAGNPLNAGRTLAYDHLIEVMDDKPNLKEFIKRTWHSILMETTRDEHADLDGVPEDENGMWDCGGTLARWPGDVVLPANMRINCYCSILVIFGLDDAEATDLREQYQIRVMEREAEFDGPDKRFIWGRVKSIKSDGDNCGTGAGGFQPGNTCARGGGGLKQTEPITNPKVAAAAIAKEAIEYAKRLLAQDRLLPSDIPTEAEIIANWGKVFRARKTNVGDKPAFKGLDQELGKEISRSIVRNNQNVAFQEFVDRHGESPIIYRRQEKGSSAAAEYRGVIHVYENSFWRGETIGECKPGELSTAGGVDGYAGVLRHEYGHRLYATLTLDQQREWYGVVPDSDAVKTGLTQYAAKNKEEAFCELFAIATDTRYDPKVFPDWVDQAHQKQREWLLKK